VGRAVSGTLDMIADLVRGGKSICLLGRPGVGKTTMLRECARLLSAERRVVIVDTSNEIAGDSDIPHPAIGRARRMQVIDTSAQHAVMIEAVENHMPEVIVIDEIGTEAEALAARTIAERGVQLIGTAHGQSLQNLLMNPTLSDLVGGISSVTLSDEEARRRGTRKSVLERKLPPTFDIVVEIISRSELAIHENVAATIDALLRGVDPEPEVRKRTEDGNVEVVREARTEKIQQERFAESLLRFDDPSNEAEERLLIFPFGVSRNKIERAIRNLHVNAGIARKWDDADVVLSLKSLERKDSAKLRAIMQAEAPVYTLKTNTTAQIQIALREIFDCEDASGEEEEIGLQEAQEAITRVLADDISVELTPQTSYVRRLQHQLAEQSSVQSSSTGFEPNRRVKIFRGYDSVSELTPR
jgi:nucleoside-triphosphatase THEP1